MNSEHIQANIFVITCIALHEEIKAGVNPPKGENLKKSHVIIRIFEMANYRVELFQWELK